LLRRPNLRLAATGARRPSTIPTPDLRVVPVEPTPARRLSMPLWRLIGGCLAAGCALLGACSPQRDATPLPTKQTTIDPVTRKLDAAAEQEQKRREDMEAAAKQ
jgi:hypothetical protein